MAATGYLQHNLVADVAGVADVTDANLVNGWGIAFSATGPFWLCDGGTGLSTVYAFSATAFSVSTTKAAIPPSTSGGNTVCTGIVASSSGFLIGPAPGRPASFIFATEGGTISAWANAVDATHALMQVDNSGAGAVYKGLALVTTLAAPQIYAANFHSGAIEVYDSNFKPVPLAVGAFTDPSLPPGFAPFNIQNLGGNLYVTYAKQDANKKFDVSGAGSGYVDIYDTDGKLVLNMVSGGPLNSPWGLQIAPATFGKFGGDLLVGNFGDGLINAFDTKTRAFMGTLQDQNGANIRIPGLWGLQFGNGGNGGDPNTLFFTAGPSGQQHGIFGSIQANPIVTAAGVQNAAFGTAGVAPNTWIAVFGTSLSATARSWKASDFQGNNLPGALDNVSVTVNGKPAYVSFVSPKQINALTPPDMPVGNPVQVVVSNGGLTTDTISVPTQIVAPAFFLEGGKYVAATHINGALLGPTTLFPSNSTPAKPGETVVLYGNGFGVTTPAIPSGTVVSGAPTLNSQPTILINNAAAKVIFAGMTPSTAGLYQFNIVVPDGLPDGDNQVVVQVNGISSPASGVFLTIQN